MMKFSFILEAVSNWGYQAAQSEKKRSLLQANEHFFQASSANIALWAQQLLAVFLISLLSPQLTAAPFTLPPAEKFKTPNGIEVFLVKQSEVPLLHISIGVKGGSSLDDAPTSGLAAFTAAALPLGTQSFKKADLETRLDFLGAELETGSQVDFSSIDLSLASKDLEGLLPLLAEVLMAPKFPEAELIKLKERRISDLKKQRESPNQLASQYFNKLLYEQHAYGRPVSGSPLSVSRITRQQVLQFYRASYRPERTAISVVGDFDSSQMKKLIESTFGSWQVEGEAIPLNSSPLPSNPGKAQVLLVNKSDATETTFRIGGPGIPRSSPDWVSLQVINTVLGGRFTSWLNDELRVKSGLTYGAGSRFDALKLGGSFAMSSFTANANSFKAIDLAISTYNRFLKEGFDQATLDSAKAYVKGQFPPRFETQDSLASTLIELWVYDLSEDRINRFQSEVDALSLDSSRALIKRYFPEKLDLLLIGKASELRSGAAKYGQLIQADMEKIDDSPLSRPKG